MYLRDSGSENFSDSRWANIFCTTSLTENKTFAYQGTLGIRVPRDLNYQIIPFKKGTFEDDVPSPEVGYVIVPWRVPLSQPLPKVMAFTELASEAWSSVQSRDKPGMNPQLVQEFSHQQYGTRKPKKRNIPEEKDTEDFS